MTEIKPHATKILPDDKGCQTRIAEALGVSRQRIHEILSGRVGIGRKMSIRLEDVTGIPKIAWIFPEEHANPFIKKNSNEA